jgi:ribosome-associated protein
MSKSPARPRKRAASPRLPADLKLAMAAALDKKAVDSVVLDLRKASAFTDFFLLCTGNNSRQVQAIGDAIEEALRKKGLKPSLVEGRERAEWMLLDYFDFIVHIFTSSTRLFYDLVRLWGDAKRIEESAS